MPTSICPECSEEVFVATETEQGDDAHCDECGSNLTVVGLDPFELDLKDESAVDEMATGDSFDIEDDPY